MYLESFTLPTDREAEILEQVGIRNGGPERKTQYVNNPYPCGLFSARGLATVRFAKITVFYGGNGSGKSTLLNLIAQKLELNRIAPFNSSETFDDYVGKCEYELGYDDEGFRMRIPNGSRIITSDDIFDYMLTVRVNNEEIEEKQTEAREKWAELKFGDTVRFTGMEDYEALRLQIQARRKSQSRKQFIRKNVGEGVRLNSNGETALRYFEVKLKDDTLYCLDEPENSMSPKMQPELVKMLEEMAHYCGCQFIIATHSPFLLAMENARIYDLDAAPVTVRNWWELENTKLYFEFFDRHRKLFENGQK